MPSQIDLLHPVASEGEIQEPVCLGGSETNGLTEQGFPDMVARPLVGDPPLLVDLAHKVPTGVDHRRHGFGIGSPACLAPAGGNCRVLGSMRPHLIVNIPPGVEAALSMCLVLNDLESENPLR